MSAKENTMSQMPLYPIHFKPIYQYRIWGGRNLADLLSEPLPGDDPIGEAWVLSDRDDHASLVANGSLKGISIACCGRSVCISSGRIGNRAGNCAAGLEKLI
jgi:hypothetical protein